MQSYRFFPVFRGTVRINLQVKQPISRCFSVPAQGIDFVEWLRGRGHGSGAVGRVGDAVVFSVEQFFIAPPELIIHQLMGAGGFLAVCDHATAHDAFLTTEPDAEAVIGG